MTKAAEQASVVVSECPSKAWSKPTLEKVEMSETAAGIDPNGSFEDRFPFFPAS